MQMGQSPKSFEKATNVFTNSELHFSIHLGSLEEQGWVSAVVLSCDQFYTLETILRFQCISEKKQRKNGFPSIDSEEQRVVSQVGIVTVVSVQNMHRNI